MSDHEKNARVITFNTFREVVALAPILNFSHRNVWPIDPTRSRQRFEAFPL